MKLRAAFTGISQIDMRIAIIEVGGTVGDIESQPFLESIRRFQHGSATECDPDSCDADSLSERFAEMKTKPTQASVRSCKAWGFSPISSYAAASMSWIKP